MNKTFAKAHWLVEGSRAPALTAIDQNGAVVQLSDYYAKGPVLVYFFFRSGTPVCTVHACRLRDGLLQLRERNVEIFGVSTESPERLKRFETRHRLPFRLLADSDGRIANAFGVNSFLGLPARRAFLVVDGLVSWEGHASEAAAKVINGFR
ncbi:MAG: redoxin domain-containing protein [Terrimicrobiaceae bacterium]